MLSSLVEVRAAAVTKSSRSSPARGRVKRYGVNKRPTLPLPSLGRSIAWLADRRRDPSPINRRPSICPECSCRCFQKLGKPDQIMGRKHQDDDGIHPVAASQLDLGQASGTLDPAMTARYVTLASLQEAPPPPSSIPLCAKVGGETPPTGGRHCAWLEGPGKGPRPRICCRRSPI